MKDILKDFLGKTLRVCTISGVEPYLGVLEEVKDDYVVFKGYAKKDKMYLAIQHIESFKEEVTRG